MRVPGSDVPKFTLVKPPLPKILLQNLVGLDGGQGVAVRAWLLMWNFDGGKYPETARRAGSDQHATGLVGHS